MVVYETEWTRGGEGELSTSVIQVYHTSGPVADSPQ